MKKLILTSVFFATLFIGAIAQSSQIACVSHKEVYRVNGEWGEWPDYWTSYKSEGRSNPIIRITTIGESSNGYIYRMQFFIDGIIKGDFFVTYDSERSAQVRKNWNDEYINCYKDKNGDYIYTQKVSLQSLAQDPSSWKNNENSMLYLMMYSDDWALVVR